VIDTIHAKHENKGKTAFSLYIRGQLFWYSSIVYCTWSRLPFLCTCIPVQWASLFS